MSPLPTGTEVDGAIPYAGQFFDKGAAVYNVMHPDFGATGNGTADDYNALVLAVAAAAGGVLYFPPGTYVIGTNLTIGTGITVVVAQGALLSPSSGRTLTVSGDIQAGTYKIVTGAGTVALSHMQDINVVWYSTSGVGTAASRWVGALANAWAGCGTDRKYVMPAGEYSSTTTTTIAPTTGSVTIEGAGEATTWYYLADNGTSCLVLGSAGNPSYYWTVRDLRINGNNTDGQALEIINVADSLFDNLLLDHFNNDDDDGTGLLIRGWTNLYFRKLQISYCDIGVYMRTNPHSTNNDLDLFHFEDVLLSCNNTSDGICMKIDVANAGNLTIDGTNEFSNAKYAIEWISNFSGQQQGFLLSGGRAESVLNTCIIADFSAGDEFVNFIVRDFLNGQSGTKFANLNNVRQVLFENVYSPGGAMEIITANANVKPLELSNFIGSNNMTDGIGADKIFERSVGGLGTEVYDALYDTTGFARREYSNVFNAARTLTYGTSIAVPSANARTFLITADDTVAFTINNPTGSTILGTEITFIIKNASGGTIGNISTGTGYREAGGAALGKPANGNYSAYTFKLFATGVWVEIHRAENCS